ncbi:DUF389 domain-containing protein [Pseudonocardia sp. RS010]|uniref:DUF389 domain-containing protein n=1 Tax=Pseudonocardia sp. RS010 TaxID=3385979 RepID=UPI0039A3655A
MTGADVDRMVDRLFVDTHRKTTAFWALLTLAAVIAGAGVVADSTATVIGAMIVAPLMTPILGTALAVVLGDRRRTVRGITLIVLGAAAVVAIAYVLGLLVPEPVVAPNNSQVAGRVSPHLVDLVAALATGVVGAFALVRSDVSDALPGVAIAISLVPPLAVVGMTLESGAPRQALGAFLLFATNVAAIVATGTLVLLAYRIRAVAEAAGRPVARIGPRTLVVVFGFLVLVTVPLTIGSLHALTENTTVAGIRPVAERWASASSWQIVGVSSTEKGIRIDAVGPPPTVDVGSLRRDLDAAGFADVPVEVSLVVGGIRELPAQ